MPRSSSANACSQASQLVKIELRSHVYFWIERLTGRNERWRGWLRARTCLDHNNFDSSASVGPDALHDFLACKRLGQRIR